MSNNRRYIKYGIALVVVGLVAWIAMMAYTKTQFGEVSLTVIPDDATISVNGSNYHNTTKLDLKPGHYTVQVSRDGFSSQTVSYDVSAGKQQAHEIVLSPNSPVGVAWLKQHPSQEQAGEAYSGKIVDQGTATLQQRYPILAVLPAFTNGTWKIDSGPSKKYPNDNTKIALYITATNDGAKAEALQWMQSQGYNPADYEIVYIVYSDLQSGNSD